jgi:histidinol-phosphate/aromatic aminotransferase/cobyric acid decarboxylase-like protein
MDRLLKEQTTNTLRLDKNECLCPSFIRELLKVTSIEDRDYLSYSSTLDIETELISLFNNVDLSIYTDNGSEQVLKSLVSALSCDKWIVPTPTFEMFSFYCLAFKKSVEYIPYTYTGNKFDINLNTICAQDCGLYVVSPHNPTGCILTEENIIELCMRYKYVIVDQAYLSPLQDINLKSFPKNLIIVRSFSKMGGLTGMRFGFCITSNNNLIYKLNKMRPMYLNSMTIKLVTAILSYPYLLHKIPYEFERVKNILNLNAKIISEAGNFILIEGIKEYKNYKLKEYAFDQYKFYRMTLFDIETYNKL